MNRARRVPLSKQFVPGGVYDGNGNINSNYAAQRPEVQYVAPAVIEIVPELAVPEINTLANVNASIELSDVQTDIKEEKGGAIFKKLFLKRKKSSVRLKEKKLRQNRQLRKAITPKNALMALNEVKGVIISDFTIVTANNNTFNAVVTVNSKQYEGRGPSKMAAKNDACEKALRDYVIEKMRRFPRNSKHNQQAQQNELMNSDEPMEEYNGNESMQISDSIEESDDVPMINLASFALFKLFSNWESEGYEIPELHPSQHLSSNTSNGGSENGSVAKEPNKPTIRHELPNDWQSLHPATLLFMMRPGLNYYDNAPIVEKNNVIQNVYVVVDGIQFNGQGRSKRIARRNAATDACNQLFNTNFVKTD